MTTIAQALPQTLLQADALRLILEHVQADRDNGLSPDHDALTALSHPGVLARYAAAYAANAVAGYVPPAVAISDDDAHHCGDRPLATTWTGDPWGTDAAAAKIADLARAGAYVLREIERLLADLPPDHSLRSDTSLR